MSDRVTGYAADFYLTAADREEERDENLLGIEVTAREVIAGWRATARIKADKSLYAQALAPTEVDYGLVEAIPVRLSRSRALWSRSSRRNAARLGPATLPASYRVRCQPGGSRQK